MARYMLDTDTCSYIMKRSNPAVLRLIADVIDGTTHRRSRGGRQRRRDRQDLLEFASHA